MIICALGALTENRYACGSWDWHGRRWVLRQLDEPGPRHSGGSTYHAQSQSLGPARPAERARVCRQPRKSCAVSRLKFGPSCRDPRRSGQCGEYSEADTAGSVLRGGRDALRPDEPAVGGPEPEFSGHRGGFWDRAATSEQAGRPRRGRRRSQGTCSRRAGQDPS